MTEDTLSFGTHREKANQDVVWLLKTDFSVPESQYVYFLQIRSPKHIYRIFDILTKVTLKKYKGNEPFYSASPMEIYNDVIALIAQLGLSEDEYTIRESLSDLAQ